jgi:hypothetical protein
MAGDAALESNAQESTWVPSCPVQMDQSPAKVIASTFGEEMKLGLLVLPARIAPDLFIFVPLVPSLHKHQTAHAPYAL